MGSCEISAIMFPRIRLKSRSGMTARSAPSNMAEPAVTRPPSGSRPSRARVVMVFPHPDSPTMPSASPGARSKLTSLITGMSLPPAVNATVRPRTDNIEAGGGNG